MSNRFYMMCTRETVGSNASFHCHNGNGYSSNIDRAHVYTREEAQRSWELGREIDQPVCADSVDAMSVWHVDCQYIPTESVTEAGCDSYVAYKKGYWNGNDVYWLQSGGLPTNDFSKAFVFVSANTEEPGVVWLPFSMADSVKRRTFSINEFNRRTMVQAAGLVMPEWLKNKTAGKRHEAERFAGTALAAEKLAGSTTHMILKVAATTHAKDGDPNDSTQQTGAANRKRSTCCRYATPLSR